MSINYNVRVELYSKQKVFYMRRNGSYGIENNKLMEKFKTWVDTNYGFCDDTVLLGIALDDVRSTESSRCRYDVCLVVSEEESISDVEVESRTIEGGKYVIFEVVHTANEVARAWNEALFILQEQGYQLDDTRPILERYEKKKVDSHYCELCFPIF